MEGELIINTLLPENLARKRTVKNEFKKRRPKKPKTLGYDAKLEEERLEKLIFGHGSDILDAIEDDETSNLIPEQETKVSIVENNPAWVDNDPGEFISNRIEKFEKIVGTPKWAELNRESHGSQSDDEDDTDILRKCGNLIATNKRTTLQRGTIEIKHLRNLNYDTYTEGPIIKAVEFHPTSTVALVAGVSGIATLFQVDGKTNAKLQSVQFQRFPIHCAKLSKSGTEFLVGSQHHSYFYSYDMEVGQSVKINTRTEITSVKNFELSPDGQLIAIAGRFGEIHLLTADTKEQVSTLKMNGQVAAICFSGDSSKLYSHGDCGEVYIWDVNSRTCIERFTDDGCISGRTLAVGEQYLATGSSSGVVNIYSAAKEERRVPLKALLHLRTAASCLQFNAGEEVLAMASDYTVNAVKLVHFPSFTVFSDFPGKFDKLWRPQCLAFSPNSGYLAIGNNRGTAMLFRLKHYGNY